MAEAFDFEAKSEPYDLDSAADRYELAKDVSGFANASGGHLLIGVKTEAAPDQDLDVVTSLNVIEEDALSIGQYTGILSEYIYPVPQGLEVWFAAETEGGAGVLVIHVPPQHPDAGPFLICRVAEDGSDLKQIVVGFVQRQGDHNTPLSPRLLQQRFKKGSDTVSLRLGRIEDKLDALVEPTEQTSTYVSNVDRIARRMTDILEPGA